MIAFYCDHFVLPLPEGHRFPMSKYSRLRLRLLDEGVLRSDDLREPDAASDEQRLVLEDCRHRGIPVAVVMSGGYARDIDDIVSIHTATVRAAANLYAGVTG